MCSEVRLKPGPLSVRERDEASGPMGSGDEKMPKFGDAKFGRQTHPLVGCDVTAL